MKKLLSLLVTSSLIGTTAQVVPNIIEQNNIKLETNDQYAIDWRRILEVPYIDQATSYYCVPTSIQMILSYFGVNIDDFSQERIYRDLGGQGQEGLEVGFLVGHYITDTINLYGGITNLVYSTMHLNSLFGEHLSDLLIFESYVVMSMYHNSPLLFSYDNGGISHAVVITGVEVDQSNPAATVYYVNDPEDPYNHFFHGNDLQNLLIFGGSIVGTGTRFNFQTHEIEIEVDSRHYEQSADQLGDESIYSYPQVNLTAAAGIVSLNRLQKMSEILFKGFEIEANWGEDYDKKLSAEQRNPTDISWVPDYYKYDHDMSWVWDWGGINTAWLDYFWSGYVERDIAKDLFLHFNFKINSGISELSTTNIYYKAWWGSSMIIAI